MGQTAGGFFIDEDGRVWMQPYKTANGTAQVSYLGQVERDARGRLVPRSIRQLLAETCRPYSFIATLMMYQDEMVALQEELDHPRPITITNAMAAEHAVLHMGSRKGTILSIFQERRGTEVALFDWDDDVLETLATRFCPPRLSDEKPEHRFAAAIGGALADAGYGASWPIKHLVVVIYDEDGSVVPIVKQALAEPRLRNAIERLETAVKGRADVLSGAAIRTSVLYGEHTDFLSLDATWYQIDLACEGHRYRLLERSTTVPTYHREQIDLQSGDIPYLELVSPTDDRCVTRWSLPLALLPKDSGKGAVPLEVAVDVDANFSTKLIVKDGRGFERTMGLSEVKAAGGKRRAQSDVSEEIMDIISILDDVDLGLASLSERERQSGAGQGLVALQKRLITTLVKRGVSYYPAVGKLFDPQIHQAVATVSHPGLPNNCVVEEVRRGFVYGGRIIRYSHVKVANPL